MRVLASNKATSGIILGYFGLLGGHWGDQWCPKGIQGRSAGPLTALIIPLEVSYGTRRRFKHPMMVQLANVHWIDLINLNFGLWVPPVGPPNALLEQIKPYGTAEIPEIPVCGVYNA